MPRRLARPGLSEQLEPSGRLCGSVSPAAHNICLRVPARAGRQRPWFLVTHKVLESWALPASRPLRPIAGSTFVGFYRSLTIAPLWVFVRGRRRALTLGPFCERVHARTLLATERGGLVWASGAPPGPLVSPCAGDEVSARWDAADPLSYTACGDERCISHPCRSECTGVPLT